MVQIKSKKKKARTHPSFFPPAMGNATNGPALVEIICDEQLI
jgi:hypothetical protein